MSVKIKGTGGSAGTRHIRWIPKYTFLERLGHWVHAVTYIPLAITGFIIFAPWFANLVQGGAGQTFRLVHRICAILLGLMPIIYAVVEPKRLVMHLRENFRFTREDIGWLKAAIPYYVLGRHVDMPPQPRFNTGERLNAVTIILGTVLFGLTGFVMWFGRGFVPPVLFQLAVILHDLTAIVTFVMFIVHFFLAVVHPLMWQSLVSMRYGVVSESYARKHHAMWYYGEKRARELWEQHKAEPGD
jgi:formate dehydrogenase subunit gamma